jgi:hypothetical protein
MLDICGKLLAAGLRSFNDNLQQEGTLALAIIIIVQAYTGSEGA